MSDDVDEELLSAYLDDEATPEQRFEVERCLRDNADWRRLFDELRALRASVQALPRYRLDDDLTRRVLADAEKRRLNPAEPVPLRPSAGQGARPPARPADELRRRLRSNWRLWAWPAIAVAAALLIRVLESEHKPQRMAQAPRAGEGAPAANSESSRPAFVPPGEAPRETWVGAAPEPLKKSIERRQEQPDQQRQMAKLATADDRKETAKLEQAEPRKQMASQQLSAPLEPAASPKQQGAPPSAIARDQIASDVRAQRPQVADGAPDRNGLGDNFGGQGAPARAMTKSKADVAADALAPRSEPNFADSGALVADDGVLVVELKLRPEALQRGAFNDLLVRNSIITDGAVGNVANNTAPALNLRQNFNNLQRMNKNASEPQSAETPMGELYCEASPRQIAATLAEIQRRPDEFAAVAVQPAAQSNRQRALVQYNRAGGSLPAGGIDSYAQPAPGAAAPLRAGASASPMRSLGDAASPAKAAAESRGARRDSRRMRNAESNGAKAAAKAPEAKIADDKIADGLRSTQMRAPAAANLQPAEKNLESEAAEKDVFQAQAAGKGGRLADAEGGAEALGSPRGEPGADRDDRDSVAEEPKMRVVFLLWTASPTDGAAARLAAPAATLPAAPPAKPAPAALNPAPDEK